MTPAGTVSETSGMTKLAPMTVVNTERFTGFLIRRAQQAHVAAWQREVSGEITSVQFGVLSLLHNSPGASQRDLCAGLDLDRSTIADIVVRLQRRGLIERARDKGDRRRNVLQLTELGEMELAALVPRVERMDEILTDHLSSEDREHLRALLLTLLDATNARNITRTPPA